MGTVGLNFGSPTSGDGFDVASTVSTIVTNLQKVEQPWKDQLASLQAQDTVISTLGSLLSRLSTDIGTLTDFEGALAQKAGASSNQNVLQLTSASSSAAAGTHTVVVHSLAQTSSGYLAPIADASQFLAGAITLKVGTGTAKTITLGSSNNTLAGLAATINASGAGVTASVLTDASGSRLSLVSGTSGAAGNITVVSSSIAPVLGLSVTDASSENPASATLAAVASPAESLSGSISVAVGGGPAQVITMSDVSSGQSGSTLDDLTAYINSNTSTLGFSATILQNSDGTASLQIISGTSGSDGNLTVSSSLADAAATLKYTQAASGANASITVDGADLAPSSNTVSNLIPGITFQLLSPSSTDSGGKPQAVQVTIANDNSSIESSLSQFVTDYNALISAIKAQEGKDSSGDPAPLFGSPTLSLVRQQLLGSLNATNPNGYLDAVSASGNSVLSGSITIQVGTKAPQTITLDASQTTIQDLSDAINAAGIGATAAVVTKNGESTLTLTSQTPGPNGALSITSSILSTADSASTSLAYTSSSNVTNLNLLGISANNDGSLTLDTAALDSQLNINFNSVAAFFQNANSWGRNFVSMLANAGTTSSKGVLALAANANTSIESQLNKKISSQEDRISAQKARLTEQLNLANQILQAIPTQLNGMDQLYSAISGYNRK